MKDVAFVFPGQGAQFVGMGKDFYESSPAAQEIFDQAESIVGDGFRDVVFNGPAEKLTSTAFCQPAILTMSIAALHALKAHPKFKETAPKFTAGLSLGEYSAHAASESMSFEDTLKLVGRRSALMEEATKTQTGKMSAIIGLDKHKVFEVCQKTGAQVANFNSPAQIVITGAAAKVEEAGALLKEAGAKSVIPLDVSGAFHSSLMASAAEQFVGVLEKVSFNSAKIPVVCNVDGQPVLEPEEIRLKLAQQITSSVQWVDSINYMVGQGVTHFIEIGPGKVLCGLIKRIDRKLTSINIQNPQDIEKL